DDAPRSRRVAEPRVTDDAPRGSLMRQMSPAGGSTAIIGRISQWIHPQETQRRSAAAPHRASAPKTPAAWRSGLGRKRPCAPHSEAHTGAVSLHPGACGDSANRRRAEPTQTMTTMGTIIGLRRSFEDTQ